MSILLVVQRLYRCCAHAIAVAAVPDHLPCHITQPNSEHKRASHLTFTCCVQVLKEVAELAKYYCRSSNLGYKRVMQQFLASQGTSKDSADEYGQAVNSLRALWGPQRIRALETVSVRFLL